MAKKKNNIKNKIGRKFVYADSTFEVRVLVFMMLIIILFIILFIKLFDVTVLNNKKYKESLDVLSNNVIEGDSTPRGRILDRNYNVIVDNKAVNVIFYKKSKNVTTNKEIKLAYEVSSMLSLPYEKVTDDMLREFYYLNNKDKLRKRITKSEWKKKEERKISNNDIEDLEKKRITAAEVNSMTDSDRHAAYLYYLMNKGYTYSEKTIKSGDSLTDSEFAYIAENTQKLDGFGTKTDWERTYPYGDTFRTILGNVSTSSQGIPSNLKDYYLSQGYSLNDRVGLSYLEKEYESYLKGTKGKYELLNSYELKEIKSGKRGNDIVLTIDINLQRELENILSEEVRRAKSEANTNYYDHSSVIIQDPNTGEILAMSSKKIVGDKIVDNTESIITNAITPGSVVKGASMLVGYNTGAIKIGEKIVDECIKVAGAPQKCSFRTLGLIDDITALAKSSNVYQFKTAIRVNGQEYHYGMKLNFNQKAFDTYRNMYHQFGLGVKTGIDLDGESSGVTAKDTKAGNLLDYVMGQYEAYTPIELSQYVTTIANGGDRLQPHLLKEVRESSETKELGKVIYKKDKNVLNKIDTKPEYMARVKEGFYAVMHSNGGYGVGYVNPNLDAAGKTGTSQSFKDTNGDGKNDTETITSSFVGYLPANNPKISIVVTSPDSSYPNSSNSFTSLVTLHITKAVTSKYAEMFPLS